MCFCDFKIKDIPFLCYNKHLITVKSCHCDDCFRTELSNKKQFKMHPKIVNSFPTSSVLCIEKCCFVFSEAKIKDSYYIKNKSFRSAQ